MNEHLDSVDIASYVNGECGWIQKKKIQFHLANCSSCRELVDNARRNVQEECDMAEVLKRYSMLENEADSTMTAPTLKTLHG